MVTVPEKRDFYTYEGSDETRACHGRPVRCRPGEGERRSKKGKKIKIQTPIYYHKSEDTQA